MLGEQNAEVNNTLKTRMEGLPLGLASVRSTH